MTRVGILTGLLFILLTPSLVASQEASETVKELVGGSPWKGTWSVASYSGTLDVVFSEKDGKLRGVIENTTGSPTNFAGEVLFLKVKKGGKVEFSSKTGAAYDLTLKDGILKGTIYPRQGPDGKAELKATKK